MIARFCRAAGWRIVAWRDGSPSFADYRTLLRQERMSRGELDALRREKTRRLVAACLRDVPYYGDLMTAAGIRAETVDGPRDLEVLPLLDKATIRAHGARMLNRSADPSTYKPHTTSGSTGMPLDFYRAFDYDNYSNLAADMRSLRRMGWRPGDPIARFWSLDKEAPLYPGVTGRMRRQLRRWLSPPQITFNAYASSRADMAGWITRLRELRPRFLYGYASVLTLFANYLHHRGERIEGVRGIASTAEALMPDHRTLLREVFPGSVVIDIYGAREIPGIASECRFGTMHISDDLVHVEHLPVPDEEGKHRLVVTALDNTLFPFIRYDIGDYGSPRTGPCPCGLVFPSMEWGVGKILDSFISPAGKIMYGGWFEGLMYRVRGVHAYQFRQRAPSDIVLYVVPTDEFDDASRRHLAGVEEKIRAEFSPEATLRVEHVASIPLTPAGKHRFVVSDVRNPVLQPQGDRPAAG
jgi:phenylacetate-CoA ligase